jgi:hypothetical protein
MSPFIKYNLYMSVVTFGIVTGLGLITNIARNVILGIPWIPLRSGWTILIVFMALGAMLTIAQWISAAFKRSKS